MGEPDTKSDYGLENLLFIAVERDWQEAAKQLLDLGANPNSASFQKHGHGPLYVAASKKLVSLCKLLVSRGALLNSSDHERDPMIQAILNGSVDAAETLLSLGSRCKCNERLTLKKISDV
jgi:ankyrin repeat protein